MSPAGNIDENVVRDAVAILESWGLVPETGENALCENGRFSGSVEERMSDLQRAFDDPSVRLVFFAQEEVMALFICSISLIIPV